MKLLICSDIHGDRASLLAVTKVFNSGDFDRLVLLGDLYYHGPRNDLPSDYNPKAVIEILNSLKDRIIAVRGNCDTEVDQMVSDFPILADYALIYDGNLSMFITHGHKFNTETPPCLAQGQILIHGHTHIIASEDFGNGNLYLNPGSVSIPKGGNKKSYMTYSDGVFTVYSLDGEIITETRISR